MRNARGMDGESDAGRDKDRLARVVSTISTRTGHTWVARPGRLAAGISLWLLTTAALLCASPSLAQATSSFYWYGENDSTCWQTGQLGSSSSSCDSVGPGYLSVLGGNKGGLAHMDEVYAEGIGEDINLTSDGDYCNYYKIGDDITSREEE